MQEKNMQTSGANSEHKHSEMERFSTLNYSGFRFMPRFSFCFFFKLETQKTPSLLVSSVTCTNQSL